MKLLVCNDALVVPCKTGIACAGRSSFIGAKRLSWRMWAYSLKSIRHRRIVHSMKFVFGPARDAIDREKRGVPLGLAEIQFAGSQAITTENRFDYAYIRQIALGMIEGGLLCAAYGSRQAERRVFSLRKANKREVNRHTQGNS